MPPRTSEQERKCCSWEELEEDVNVMGKVEAEAGMGDGVA